MNILRKTMSTCPICLDKIPADIIDEDGKVYLVKKCKNHGEFKDVYFGSTQLYAKLMEYFDGDDSDVADDDCPNACGICDSHKSSTVLANIDLTSACNFRCPVCFAHSEDDACLYQPSIDDVARMMDILRHGDPPCHVLQLSGGEPTLHEDFFEIARLAREKGFVQLQVATNGKILAENPDFAKRLAQADFDTVYLQFDGVTPEPYIALRGFNALPLKVRAIENIRKYGPRPNIVLVPTLVKGINDGQIGDIIRFAAENIDVVRGIVFQPVSYTGRIQNEELLNRRYTIPDLMHAVQEQTENEVGIDDFLPVSAASPLLEFLERFSHGSRYPVLSTHPACGVWTFAFKDRGKLIPLTRIIRIDELLTFLDTVQTTSKSSLVVKITAKLHRLIRPQSIRYAKRIKNWISDLLTEQSVDSASAFTNNPTVLFIGAMHFMDAYNFDFQRVKRCCIHYATPDGRVIPFCSYNVFYREKVESAFRVKS